MTVTDDMWMTVTLELNIKVTVTLEVQFLINKKWIDVDTLNNEQLGSKLL